MIEATIPAPQQMPSLLSQVEQKAHSFSKYYLRIGDIHKLLWMTSVGPHVKWAWAITDEGGRLEREGGIGDNWMDGGMLGEPYIPDRETFPGTSTEWSKGTVISVFKIMWCWMQDEFTVSPSDSLSTDPTSFPQPNLPPCHLASIHYSEMSCYFETPAFPAEWVSKKNTAVQF